MANVQVLVVEDYEPCAQLIQDFLKAPGYDVWATVSSGEEALQTVAKTAPDLVLMDIHLAGAMDGVTAAVEIQSRFNLPVIYITAYADEPTVKRALRTEPFGYLLKPFNANELRTTIELALYKHQMEMRVKESERWLATILKNIGDAVVAVDVEGRVTFINPVAEALVGIQEHVAAGTPLTAILNVMNEQMEALTQEAVMNALRQDLAQNLTRYTRLRAKDGSEAFIESSVAFIHERPGQITGAVLVFRDITERKREEENRAHLIKRVIEAQEEERRWIAQELHDETGQSLTFLLLGLRMIENARWLKKAKAQAKQLHQITTRILTNLGHMARGLHPAVLDDLGLVVALNRHASDYVQSRGIAVDVHTQGLDSSRLPSPIEIALYRIVQEALTNIAKHAHAKRVSIVLTRNPSGIQAIIEDDGCGFDVETTLRTAAISGHLGLYGMRERAALLGGSVTIEAKEGKGTTVSVHLPLGA